MRQLYTILIVLVIWNAAYVRASSGPGSLLFETVTANNANITSQVYTTLQDPRGFIWLGTDAGLMRYDGYSSIRLKLPDPDHSLILATSTVEILALQNNNSLWIGSSQGLISLDLNTWETLRPRIFQNLNIRALLIQNDTCIWVGTNQGLYKYNPENEQAIYFSQTNSGLSQNMIRALYLDQSGNLWVGTADKLNVLQSGTRRFQSFDLKGEYKADINHNLILDIQSLQEGTDSILFVGTETGLCLFNRFRNTVQTYNETNCELSNEVVKTIYIKNPSEIYFGTDLGFNKMNLENDQIESYYHNPFNQYSITNNQIWKITPDSRGDLWLATSNGISRLKSTTDLFSYFPVYFHASGEPSGTRVSDVSYDSKGSCWVGTTNGLVRLSEQSEAIEEYMTSVDRRALSIGNINAISIDQKNRIWIGSVAGINIWDPAKHSVYIPPMDNGSGFRTASNYISSIVPGYDNFYWIGTWGGGLYKAWSSAAQLEDIQISYVADFNGYVVAGKDYLYALNGNTISTFNINTEKVESITSLKQQIGNTNFASICTSADENLWLGAKNLLLKYSVTEDSIEIIQLPVHEDFIVTGIVEDNLGMVWGCDHNTIFRFDPDSRAFNFFPLSKNIPLKKLIPFPFRKTAQGEILVCGYNGFIKFNPQDPEFANRSSHVMITALNINGIPQTPATFNDPDLELAFENRNIELEFSSFLYARIEKERYTYMLSGYDEDWLTTKAGSNRVAYNHLPPGSYIFNIKSASGDPQSEVSSIRIKVLRPFWTQPLLLVAYTLLILTIIGFIIYQYMSIRKEKRYAELIQAEKEKNELIDNSKTRFFVNVSHELLNSIGLITYPLKKLLSDKEIKDQIKKPLLLIEKNTYFLKAYVDQLLNFRTIELGHTLVRNEGTVELITFCKQVVKLFRNKAISKGVSLKFKSEIKDLKIDMDEDKLHAILQNLLSNAITFTPSGGQVVLALRHVSSEEVIIEVKDNGIGIPETDQEKVFERFYQVSYDHISNRGMGIGLTIVKDFVEVLNGRIDLKSHVGEGCSVKVTLPSHYEETQKLEEGSMIREYVTRDAIEKARKSTHPHLNGSNGLPAILIVDEDNELFEHIQLLFINKYRINWASSGEEALRFLNESVPNFILSEIQLPGMDGISFCRQVRKKANTSRIPFIFLTTNTDTEDQLKAIQAGVDVFLTKPCDFNVLEANLANLNRRIEKTEEFISRRLILNAPVEKIGSKDDKLLKEVVDYIHKNLTNSQLTAKEISYSLGISHSNLYRRIKLMTGLSLNEFVRHVRLQNAERLLAGGKLSVSEVMFEVGFTNHSYFSKCFKKQYNTTPKNYAKR